MKKEKVIIRTYSAGVHFGTLVGEPKSKDGYYEVTLENTRRIWKWSGANSLSELGTIGTSNPEGCVFSLPLRKNRLHAIEIIYMTDIAIESIESVKNWTFCKLDNKIKAALAQVEESIR